MVEMVDELEIHVEDGNFKYTKCNNIIKMKERLNLEHMMKTNL